MCVAVMDRFLQVRYFSTHVWIRRLIQLLSSIYKERINPKNLHSPLGASTLCNVAS